MNMKDRSLFNLLGQEVGVSPYLARSSDVINFLGRILALLKKVRPRTNICSGSSSKFYFQQNATMIQEQRHLDISTRYIDTLLHSASEAVRLIELAANLYTL